MKRLSVATIICALVVFAAIQLWSHNDQNTISSSGNSVNNSATPQPVNDPEKQSNPAINTHANGKTTDLVVNGYTLKLNQDGSLQPNPDVRELFDATARRFSRTPVEEWKSQFLTQLSEQLEPQALQQLDTLLDHYAEYNLALQLFPMKGRPELAPTISQLQQLQQEYLGVENQGMFEDWPEMESFSTFFVQEIVSYNTSEQLTDRLQEQIGQLPASVQPRAQRMLDLASQMFSSLDLSRPDPTTLNRMAEQVAAMALIQPDLVIAEPAPDFLTRFTLYQQAKQQLSTDSPIESDQDPRVKTLREQYFSGSELLRIKTLDRTQLF